MTARKKFVTPTLGKQFLMEGVVTSSNYSFTKNSARGKITMLKAQRIATKIINSYFASIEVLSSKLVFNFTPGKVIITTFYVINKKKRLNHNTINNLGDVLSKLFNRPVELRFIKMSSPFLSSTILAKYIRSKVRKRKFRSTTRYVYRKVYVLNKISPKNLNYTCLSYVIGLKIKISGRLVTERARPRKTVSSVKVGKFNKENGSLTDYGTYTSKNANGAFTVKVWMNQQALGLENDKKTK